MAGKAICRRLLLYVPVIHGREDMGSFADRLDDGAGCYQQAHERWERLMGVIKGLPLSWNAAKIYQDGLPDTDAGTVRRVVEAVRGLNYDLLRWLTSRGAQVLGTESPGLLKQEYCCLATVIDATEGTAAMLARARYAWRASQLLRDRDRYMARRIDDTLEPGDVGVLFVGKAHQVDQLLPQDILVVRVGVDDCGDSLSATGAFKQRCSSEGGRSSGRKDSLDKSRRAFPVRGLHPRSQRGSLCPP